MSVDLSMLNVTLTARALAPPGDRAAMCKQQHPLTLSPTRGSVQAPALYPYTLLSDTAGENRECAAEPPEASCMQDVTPFLFNNVKLHAGKAFNSVGNKCTCCKVTGSLMPTAFPEVSLILPGMRKFNACRGASSFAEELWESFGADTLASILAPDVRPNEVHQIGEGADGLNHVFLAKVRSWFVKAVLFDSAGNSEAQQMEYLKQTNPAMLTDPTLIFPTRWCRVENSKCCYDVLVYPYIEGMNVRELVTAFENSTKSCKARLWPGMLTLMRSCAHVLRRYHTTYQRKHGDAKADNFMVTQDGRILLCDLGVNALTLCEKQEFMRSIVSEDPQVAELKETFSALFDAASETGMDIMKN